jgi:hypothetical protein
MIDFLPIVEEIRFDVFGLLSMWTYREIDYIILAILYLGVVGFVVVNYRCSMLGALWNYRRFPIFVLGTCRSIRNYSRGVDRVDKQ